MGEIADEHADALFDNVFEEDDQDPGDDFSGREVHCKYCGAGPFTWVHTGVRWRLSEDDGRVHVCKTVNADTASDFDAL